MPGITSFKLKFTRSSHSGNKVSHAKNRSKRRFKYNLHTATIIVDGQRRKVRVPTKILRQLKKQGLTTHWKPEASAALAAASRAGSTKTTVGYLSKSPAKSSSKPATARA